MSNSNPVSMSSDVQTTWKRLLTLSPLNKDFAATVSKLHQAVQKTKGKQEAIEVSDDEQDYDQSENFARLMIKHDRYTMAKSTFVFDSEDDEDHKDKIDYRQTKRVRREEPIEISDDEEEEDDNSDRELIDDEAEEVPEGEAEEVPEGEEESDPESEEYDSEGDDCEED